MSVWQQEIIEEDDIHIDLELDLNRDRFSINVYMYMCMENKIELRNVIDKNIQTN